MTGRRARVGSVTPFVDFIVDGKSARFLVCLNWRQTPSALVSAKELLDEDDDPWAGDSPQWLSLVSE